LARLLLTVHNKCFKQATPSLSNCNSTDYSQFSLEIGLHQMLLLTEF